MNPKHQFICAVAIIVFLTSFGFVAKVAAATTYYVSTTGSDSNPGTQSAPFRHVSKGVAVAQAGDTVIVENGFYDNEGVTNNSSYVVTFTRSGSAGSPITVMAQNRGGATLDSGSGATAATATSCTGAYSYFNLNGQSYITIQGFVIQHACFGGIHANGNSDHNIIIRQNDIGFIGNFSWQSNGGPQGIYMNQTEHDFTFDQNVFHDIGSNLNYYKNQNHGIYSQAQNVTITNNLFYNIPVGWPLQIAPGTSNLLIANNTFDSYEAYRDGQMVLWDNGDGTSTPITNLTIRNNIFNDPSGAMSHAITSVLSYSMSGCQMDHNITNMVNLYDNASPCTIGSNKTSTDPLLVSPTASSPDLHINSGSPAIDAGTPVSGVNADYDGNSRPQGNGYDMGAYEFTTSLVSGAPAMSLSTTSLTFGNVAIGATSTPQLFTITNTGTANLTFSKMAWSGDYGPAGVGTCYLAEILTPSANCTVSVMFAPTANGTRTGSFTITDNAPGSPHVVSFSGVGGSGSTGCLTSTGPAIWQGLPFTSQNGTFQVTFDVTPQSNLINALTGLSQALATDYTSLAPIVRFNPSGFIDARNGGVYQADNSIAYTGGSSYHFRLNINVTNHTYSAYVTPAGLSEQTIGTNYAFRTEQATVTSLGYWNVEADSGSHTVCNVAISLPDTVAPTVPTGLTAAAVSTSTISLSWNAASDNVAVTGYKIYRGGTQLGTTAGTSYSDTTVTTGTTYSYTVAAFDAAGNNSAQSTATSITISPPTAAPAPGCLVSSGPGTWQGLPFTSETGSFEITFDATPGTNLENTLTGLSQTLATDYTSLAAIIRFNPAGNIDIRNGANYQADNVIPYSANTLYHFRLDVNLINHTYSAYVTPAGSSEQTIGTNYVFRTEQAAATSLGYWNVEADSGSHTVCNVQVTAIDTVAPTIPTNVVATAVSPNAVTLTWAAASDNTAVTGYKIFRNGTQVGTSAGTAFNDVGLSAGTSYSYTVAAFDAAGNVSGQSAAAAVTTLLNADVTAPVVSITSPTTGTVSGNIPVTANASDPTVAGQTSSGISLLTLSVDGSIFATSTTGSMSKSLDTTTLTNASHTITAQAKDNAGNLSTVASVAIVVNNVSVQKFPRKIKLSGLEASTSVGSTPVTAEVLSPASGSVLETESNLQPDASGNYTVSFSATDPQLVDIRVMVTGYLSSNLANVDTTVNSTSALSVPQLAAGDLNGDDVVNSLDYSLLNSHYLQNYATADINKDGLVNSLDFAVLKNNFNKTGQ